MLRVLSLGIVGVAVYLLFAVNTDNASAPTPVPPASMDSFREFTRSQLVPALRNRDRDFFRERALTENVICTPEITPPRKIGGPDCKYVGEEFQGIFSGNEGEGAIVPLESAIDNIERLSREEVIGAVDQFGDSHPQVYALGIREPVPSPGELQRFESIITALIERPADFVPGGPLRMVMTLSWVLRDDDFSLLMIRTTLGSIGEALLMPNNAKMPEWERFSP